MEKDVVAYCQKQMYPREGHTFTPQPLLPCFIDLEAHLKKRDYIPVIKWIWHQRQHDVLNVLEVLRGQLKASHPPLMYELAILEFMVNPSEETLHLTSLPLIKAASSRVFQDASCLEGSETFKEKLMDDMERCYVTHLEWLSIKHLEKKLDQAGVCLQTRREKKIKSAIIKAAICSQLNEPSEENWLRWYGNEPSWIPIPLKNNYKKVARSIAKSTIRKFTLT